MQLECAMGGGEESVCAVCSGQCAVLDVIMCCWRQHIVHGGQFRDFSANLNICNLFLQMAALEQTRDMARAHLRRRDRTGPGTELTVPAPRLEATNKFVHRWARRRARGVRCTPLSFL